MAGLNHLPDLLAVVVALNKKEIRRLFFFSPLSRVNINRFSARAA